jgi:ABC-type nickel/cobalt efflux system permease component RcnA
MKRNKQKIFIFLQFLSLVIVISILAWFAIAGGCLDLSRVKMHNNKFEIPVFSLLVLEVIGVLFITRKLFENVINILVKKKPKLTFQLLI